MESEQQPTSGDSNSLDPDFSQERKNHSRGLHEGNFFDTQSNRVQEQDKNKYKATEKR